MRSELERLDDLVMKIDTKNFSPLDVLLSTVQKLCPLGESDLLGEAVLVISGECNKDFHLASASCRYNTRAHALYGHRGGGTGLEVASNTSIHIPLARTHSRGP